MKRYIKSGVAAVLAIAIIITAYIPVIAVDSRAASYSTSSNSGQRDEVCTELSTGAVNYYKGNNTYEVLSNKSSTEIKSALSSLMRSTHSYISSYDDCHYKANITDCENNNTGKLSLIYTSYDATQSQWNGWNREHVWPKSHGGNNTSGGGADMHHIRPSDAVVNSTRGNNKYGNVNGGKEVYGKNPATGYLGGYSGGGYFEPLDNVKGDVARICLYVWVRWGSDWGADSVTEVFQSVDVLLEWCALDPVDTWEMGRNEVIEKLQGNRNVFIDYPEYAWLIFGKQVPSDMTTPSGEAKNSGSSGGGTSHTHSYTSAVTKQPTCVSTGTKTYTCSCGKSYSEVMNKISHSYSNGTCTMCGASQGGTTPPACTHSETVVKGAKTADCYQAGYTGDIYCASASCNKLISKGSEIPKSNVHTWKDWSLNENDEFTRVCIVCGDRETLTFDRLVASLDSDAEKILLFLALGVTDSALLGSISK